MLHFLCWLLNLATYLMPFCCRKWQWWTSHEEGEGRHCDTVQQPVATATIGTGTTTGGAVQGAVAEERARGGAVQETVDGNRWQVIDAIAIWQCHDLAVEQCCHLHRQLDTSSKRQSNKWVVLCVICRVDRGDAPRLDVVFPRTGHNSFPTRHSLRGTFVRFYVQLFIYGASLHVGWNECVDVRNIPRCGTTKCAPKQAVGGQWLLVVFLVCSSQDMYLQVVHFIQIYL